MFKVFSRLFLAVSLVLVGSIMVTADEGMWPLYALKSLDFDALKARGLELGPEQIYNETDGGIAAAVCQVGGGTGSFVSPEGLIITNHHVAFGAIQKQSDVNQNYLRDGFLATTKAEEIPAIGYNAYVTRSFKDVTKDVKKAIKSGMTDLERYKAIEKKKKQIVKKAEKKGDVRCWVVSAYGGMQYYLVTSFRIQDIRIVYVPPQAIGEYGGDIDNWMWPRHTGDFSFLRAYVAPDGSSAKYAEENIPFKPQAFLPISSGSLNEGDYAMIIGYPGHTVRYRSSFSVNENINYNYPTSIEGLTDILEIMEESSQGDPTAALKLSSMVKGLNNYLKNTQGMLKGLKRAGLLERKRQQEKELTEFINADPELTKKYGDVLPGLGKTYAGLAEFREKEEVLSRMSWVCRYYSLARRLYKWSIEKTKKDMEREPGYMERNVEDMKRRLKETQHILVPKTDQKLLEYFAMQALRLPEDQRILGLDKGLSVAAGEDTAQVVSEFVKALYAGTKVGDLEERMKMFEMSKEELLALDDPFINLAHELYDEVEEINDRHKAFSGAVAELRPRLIEAYAAWQKEMFYPDANGTIRLTYGEIKGYSPADATSYKYITTLSGVIEKESGEEPFANPQELLDVYASGDLGKYVDPALGDVPVNFLTTNDGTGGNSGSPVLNGKGEIIGLDFDTNWEGIIGDYYFDPVIKRSICVDSRYVLFILDRVYGAQSVLDELTIH